jgi:hypothetical protein
MVSRHPPMIGGFQTPTQDRGFPDTHPWQGVPQHLPMTGGFQTPTQDRGFPDTHPWQGVPRHSPMTGGFQTFTHDRSWVRSGNPWSWVSVWKPPVLCDLFSELPSRVAIVKFDNHSPKAINSLITQSACVYLDLLRTLNECWQKYMLGTSTSYNNF